jgi:hypothetical protein
MPPLPSGARIEYAAAVRALQQLARLEAGQFAGLDEEFGQGGRAGILHPGRGGGQRGLELPAVEQAAPQNALHQFVERRRFGVGSFGRG